MGTVFEDRARQGIEAFSRGELDSALEGFSRDVVWEVTADVAPDASVYHGHEGVRAFWAQWRELFEQFKLEVVDTEAIDDTRILVVLQAHGIGTGSGISVESPKFAQVLEFRDNQVVHVRLATTRAGALGE